MTTIRTYGVIAQNFDSFIEEMHRAEKEGFSHDYSYEITSTDPAEIANYMKGKDLANHTIEEWNATEDGDFYTGSDFDEPENWLKRHSDQHQMDVIAEMREMICLGWEKDEAEQKYDEFIERLNGSVNLTEGFSKEEILALWDRANEIQNEEAN